MMDPFSLFSKSSRNPFKTPKKSSSSVSPDTSSPAAPPSASLPSSAERPSSSVIETAIPDEEVNEYLAKLRSMTADINDKIIAIQEQSGADLKNMKKYCENPQNFTKDEWDILQRTKQVIEQQLYSALGKDYKKDIARHDVSQQDKNRTSKTLGTRKKNWISMR